MNASPPPSRIAAVGEVTAEIDGLDAPAPPPLEVAPFVVSRPAGAGPLAVPLVFASPHSGRLYPADMMEAAALDAVSIRRSEDAFVDELIGAAPTHGVATLTAVYARAYIDLNREPFELDPGMFADELPAFARARTARVAAGLGAIARIVSEGQEIYRRKLTFAEASRRIDGAHRPYHRQLTALLAEAKAVHGAALLLDWHSMPAAATRGLGRERTCDIVLGDRYGASCAPGVTDRVEQAFRARGYRVVRNTPYAGGYTTEHYGRPDLGVHALQIELNRGLYMDEAAMRPTRGFSKLKADLDGICGELASSDWTALAA